MITCRVQPHWYRVKTKEDEDRVKIRSRVRVCKGQSQMLL